MNQIEQKTTSNSLHEKAMGILTTHLTNAKVGEPRVMAFSDFVDLKWSMRQVNNYTEQLYLLNQAKNPLWRFLLRKSLESECRDAKLVGENKYREILQERIFEYKLNLAVASGRISGRETEIPGYCQAFSDAFGIYHQLQSIYFESDYNPKDIEPAVLCDMWNYRHNNLLKQLGAKKEGVPLLSIGLMGFS